MKAISTIRTLSTRTGYGSLPRPPLENRIRLYGLYKQATEGNVTGVMARPDGTTYEDENAKRKWDAWKEEEGISKTEAKRRYISFLIETMKLYASGTHEARELLSELEYLWDQIKDVDPNLNDSVHDISGISGTSPLSFLSPGFGMGSNSVSYSGSIGYDSFNESYLNQSINHHNRGGIRNEIRDVQLLKKEVNLALRRLNDEIITKNNGIYDENKNSSIFIVKFLNFFKINENNKFFKRFLIYTFKFSVKFIKKIIIDLILLILLINIIKFKNGLNLNMKNFKDLNNKNLFQKILIKLLNYSKLLELFNFNKISITID